MKARFSTKRTFTIFPADASSTGGWSSSRRLDAPPAANRLASGAPLAALWLVVSEHGDPVATFIAAGLRDLNRIRVEHIDSRDLANCVGWDHRIDETRSSARLELADGRVIDTDAIAGTVNRLATIPEPPGVSGSSDHDYLNQEMFALTLSWLHALPGPVLNPPTPIGLSGSYRPDTEWAVIAAHAGLASPPIRIPTSVADAPATWSELALPLVIGSTVLCAPSERASTACRRLATLAATPILGIALGKNADSDWQLLEVTTTPDLRAGGDDAIGALVHALTHEPGLS